MLPPIVKKSHARLSLCGLIALLAWLGPSQALATDNNAVLTPQAVIQRMEAAQHDLHTLAADFVQTSRVKLFKQDIRSFGRLLYERPLAGQKTPTRLRWEYLRPDPSTLVLVGEQARLRMGKATPSANGVAVQSPVQAFDLARDAHLRAIFGQLQLWLGLGATAAPGSVTSGASSAPLADTEYDMRVIGNQTSPALQLSPRTGSLLAKTFARVELHVDSRTWQLSRLLLVEQSGDEKEIVFHHIQRNQPLSPTAFALE